MKNILFIGGAGFIGSNLIRYLIHSRTDYNIHVLEPPFANVSRLEGMDLTVHRGELMRLDFIKSIFSVYCIDTVVHLASTLIPGSTYQDFLQEFQRIIFPSIEIMEECAQRKVKFVFFSSGGTVYGNREDTSAFKETDGMAPISYYGWSKQMLENSILFKHRTVGLDYVILRPSNPYGHGQNLNGKQGLVAVALGKALTGEPLEVWGDGTSLRDYIYIDDLCKIFKQLFDQNISCSTLNLGSGEGFSVNDILKLIGSITGRSIKVVYRSERMADVSHVVLDVSELRHCVNIQFTPLSKGIELFYKEIKKELS